MVRLTFLEKKFVFQSEIPTYSLSLIFAIACLGKKLGFRTEYCDYFEYLILNDFENRSFLLGHRVVQIEPNLVWNIPRVDRLWDIKIFWYSLLRKKNSLPYGTLRISDYQILKVGLFYWIKEFFKVNQIDIPGYQYYLSCNAKRMVHLTFLEKSSYFNRKYRLIRLFFFQKYRIFIRSRSCSNQAKHGMEYSPYR